MGSEEESVHWFMDDFQENRIVTFVLVFFRSNRRLNPERRRNSDSGCRPWSRPNGSDSILQ
jgi:hypothetical protein